MTDVTFAAAGRSEQERWLGAYNAYVEAMAKAGVLRSSTGLQPTAAATTVRVVNDKTQVLDGPYADSKEQLGGFHIIDVTDLDAAMTKLHLSECLVHSSLDAVQVHGGAGYVTETGLERDVRDALASRIYSGTSEMQRNVIARHLGL